MVRYSPKPFVVVKLDLFVVRDRLYLLALLVDFLGLKAFDAIGRTELPNLQPVEPLMVADQLYAIEDYLDGNLVVMVLMVFGVILAGMFVTHIVFPIIDYFLIVS